MHVRCWSPKSEWTFQTNQFCKTPRSPLDNGDCFCHFGSIIVIVRAIFEEGSIVFQSAKVPMHRHLNFVYGSYVLKLFQLYNLSAVTRSVALPSVVFNVLKTVKLRITHSQKFYMLGLTSGLIRCTFLACTDSMSRQFVITRHIL